MTGGAGFLGSHLCERLLAERNEVISLDNFFTGHRANIDHLIDRHDFEIVSRERSARGCSSPRPARSTAIRSPTPQVESYWGNVNPIGPRACYDEGKRCAQALAAS